MDSNIEYLKNRYRGKIFPGWTKKNFTLGNGRIVSETILDENLNLVFEWKDSDYYAAATSHKED